MNRRTVIRGAAAASLASLARDRAAGGADQLGLAAVPVGAFDDESVRSVLGAPADHVPLYLIPVGRARG